MGIIIKYSSLYSYTWLHRKALASIPGFGLIYHSSHLLIWHKSTKEIGQVRISPCTIAKTCPIQIAGMRHRAYHDLIWNAASSMPRVEVLKATCFTDQADFIRATHPRLFGAKLKSNLTSSLHRSSFAREGLLLPLPRIQFVRFQRRIF